MECLKLLFDLVVVTVVVPGVVSVVGDDVVVDVSHVHPGVHADGATQHQEQLEERVPLVFEFHVPLPLALDPEPLELIHVGVLDGLLILLALDLFVQPLLVAGTVVELRHLLEVVVQLSVEGLLRGVLSLQVFHVCVGAE